MRVHNSSVVRDNWRFDGLNPAYPIFEHMGQTRFEEIKRYLDASPPDQPKETSLGRRLWYSKLDVVWINCVKVHSATESPPLTSLWMNV